MRSPMSDVGVMCQRGKCQREATKWAYYMAIAPLLVCDHHGAQAHHTLPLGRTASRR